MRKTMVSLYRRGNAELVEKINNGLKHIKENGTYDKLVDEWFNK